MYHVSRGAMVHEEVPVAEGTSVPSTHARTVMVLAPWALPPVLVMTA